MSQTDPALDLPLDAIQAFCKRHHIRKLMLFGSVLRADFRPDSDVDVLVEFEADARPTLFDLGGIQMDLQAMIGRSVDVGTPGMLSPYIKDKVMASALVIYERK
ncbi:MAG: nucleotidyltransferase family protein [Anaerolineae bacterium]|nr:nucleotidyltransferase family protein [Anaerolineae bacterium]